MKDFLFIRGKNAKKTRWIKWNEIKSAYIERKLIRHDDQYTTSYNYRYYLIIECNYGNERFHYENRDVKVIELLRDFILYMKSTMDSKIQDKSSTTQKKEDSPKFCSYCGNETISNAKYCSLCGSIFK